MQGLWCRQLFLGMYSISAVAPPLLASSKWHGYITLKYLQSMQDSLFWTTFSQYVQHPSCGSSPVSVLHVCQWGVCFAVCRAGCGMWTLAKKCSSSPLSLPHLVSTSVPTETSWSSLTARMLPSTMLTRESVQSKATKSGISFALMPGLLSKDSYYEISMWETANLKTILTAGHLIMVVLAMGDIIMKS